jgi:hypothetical protein
VYFQPNSCNTHTEREWAQGTFLRQRRKFPPTHTQRLYFSVCLSACPSVRPSEIPKHVEFSCRNSNQGVHVEFSVRRPSPPKAYSHVREENSGLTRKVVQNYLWFTCITNLILAIHMQSVNGLEEPFYDSRGKFLQPTRSGCLIP